MDTEVVFKDNDAQTGTLEVAHDYWATLYPKKWFILGITAAAALGSFFYVQLLPNLYTSTCQIFIQQSDYGDLSRSAPGRDGVTTPGSDIDYYANQIIILKSSQISERANAELGGQPSGFSLNVRRIRGSSILELSVTSHDSEWSAKAANTYARVFISEHSKESAFINQQILQYIPNDEELNNGISRERLRQQILLARKEGVDKNIFVESISPMMSDPTISSLRERALEVQSRLDELSTRYNKNHPLIINSQALLDQLNKKILERSQVLMGSLRSALQGAIEIHTAKILEEARPSALPSGPKRLQRILFNSVAVFLGSCAFFIILEQFNPKIVTQKDLRTASLTFLGYIPFIKELLRIHADDTSKVSLIDVLGQDRLLADAAASLRTHILFSAPYAKAKRIMIASALPAEGKSTISILLSASFASIGRRVLLIDADMRRAKIGNYLRLPNVAGLSDYLVGVVTIEDSIQHVIAGGGTLDVISAGMTVSPHIPELLSTARFEELLNYGEQHYDRIVIDVPPVLHIPDGLIVAKHVNTGVLVCGSNRVHKKTVSMIKDKFSSIGFFFIGVAINRASYEKESYYHRQDHKYYYIDPATKK